MPEIHPEETTTSFDAIASSKKGHLHVEGKEKSNSHGGSTKLVFDGTYFREQSESDGSSSGAEGKLTVPTIEGHIFQPLGTCDFEVKKTATQEEGIYDIEIVFTPISMKDHKNETIIATVSCVASIAR